ncbi:type II CAAX endopeptidase family protein [Natronococcus sp. A-GB7]|uniref:CPBP family intramembrane glutamic endopeptidase n=1 Tax=Natronococcus sp. A-GB7 TaxID=3037649 RepID=UPI00241EF632|nr:type II CAAX endopeptidase family protein [Natronococcus sp. A-GB7]MDG5820547.1 type II CAAX endopeptidase family protein [Natronococcus sp. A-GB7]
MLSGDSVWTFPNAVLFLVGGSSPLVAGLSLLWLTSGRDGYRDLRHRLVETDRIRPRWWLVIVLLYPAFTLVAASVAVGTGFTSAPLEVVEPQRLLEPGSLALLLAVALVFPAVEEIGLRGYWFDQLQARWSALVASLILGVVWAAWHVPLVYMVGYYDETTFQPELWWWLPSIVLTAIIGTWVYNNTRRSVLAVIGLHFVGNLTGETMGFAGEVYPVVHLGTALVAVCLVVVWGPESLRGWDRSKPNAGFVERSS